MTIEHANTGEGARIARNAIATARDYAATAQTVGGDLHALALARHDLRTHLRNAREAGAPARRIGDLRNALAIIDRMTIDTAGGHVERQLDDHNSERGKP